MTLSAERSVNLSPSEPASPRSYTSRVVQHYLDYLAPCSERQVLDVGPVCEANIRFFARRVQRLFVCDMFLRLDRDRRQGLPPTQVWRHLDYPPESFNGIQLWDLVDHLDDNEARRLAELCHRLVKPGGVLMALAAGESPGPSILNSFATGEDLRISLSPQPHLDLVFHHRHNRDVIAVMFPFHLVKSFIYRNGIREFLFQKS